MFYTQSLRATPTFVAMDAWHVGKVLRELYLSTGFKMEHFAAGVAYDEKTIYYHFGKEKLSTGILEKYEDGLKKLGVDIDIYAHISRKRKGYDVSEPSLRMVAEEVPPYLRTPPSVADLLRQAADQLEKERQGPAPDRDKASS